MQHQLSNVSIKISYEQTKRRFSLGTGNGHQHMYESLVSQVESLLSLKNGSIGSEYLLQYLDDDKEVVSISSPSELATALQVQLNIMNRTLLSLTLEKYDAITSSISDSSATEDDNGSDDESTDGIKELKMRKKMLKKEFKETIKQMRKNFKAEMRALNQELKSKRPKKIKGLTGDDKIDSLKMDKHKLKEYREELKRDRRSIQLKNKLEKHQRKDEQKQLKKYLESFGVQLANDGTWPTQISSLLIDASSVLDCTKIMRKFAHTKETARVADQILIDLVSEFHQKMGNSSLANVYLLFNEIDDNMITRRANTEDGRVLYIQSARPAIANAHERTVQMVESCKATNVLQTCLLATCDKELVERVNSLGGPCIHAKQLLKYMHQVAKGDKKIKFNAWIEQEFSNSLGMPSKKYIK